MNYLTPESELGKRIYTYLANQENTHVRETLIRKQAIAAKYFTSDFTQALKEVNALVDITRHYKNGIVTYRKIAMTEEKRQDANDSFVWFDNLPE